MDCKGICKKDGFTFTWVIEAFSYCWLKTGEIIWSPVFATEINSNIWWCLILYPKGFDVNTKDFISFYLYRQVGRHSNFNNIVCEIDFELSFTAVDGSVLVSQRLHVNDFKVGLRWGSDVFVKREEVFKIRKKDYLPGDVLTARCRLWDQNEKILRNGHWFARTRIGIQRRSFYWTIEKFSSFKESICEMDSASANKTMTFKFFPSRGQNSETIIGVEVCAHDQILQFSTFRIHLLDSSGECTQCLNEEFMFTEIIRTALFKLAISKEELMKNKNQYLPNDVLRLYCECDIPIKIPANEGIEKICYGCPSIQEEKATSDGLESKKMHLDSTRILKENLESSYKENLLCDTKLKTKTGSFPAHKNILSARSPVFKAMFTNDMRESNSDYVDVEDLDDDTVQKMLLYIYTATLEDLRWESACNLYAAADKYEILSLKSECSSFLQNHLSSDNALDLLILLDMHHDKELKSNTEEFILTHRGIFKTNEWKLFMKTNLQLAADLMYQTLKE